MSCWNLLSKYGDFGNASDVGIAWDAREREREGIWVCASDALVLVY